MAEKRVSVRLSVEGGRILRAELDDVGDRGDRAFDRVGRSADRAGDMIQRVVGLFAAGFSLNALNEATQRWTEMGNALRVLGLQESEVETTLDRLTQIAMATHQPLQEIVTLYQRMQMAGAELGASQSEIFEFVESTALALAAQGGAASQASGALLQLGQAMGAGIVRAEEFNSIIEGAPALAQAAAAGFGVTLGELRRMVLEGEVTSEAFFNAIRSQSDALAEAFSNTELTVGQALTDLGTSFTQFVGQLDESRGVTAAVAQGIVTLAENMDVLAAVAVGLTATQIPALIGGLRALGLAASLAGGPFGIVIGLLAAGISYFALFRDEASDLPPELQAAQEAQDDLNAALVHYAQVVSPQARANVIAQTNDLIAMKQALLDTAEAQLVVQRTRLAGIGGFPDAERLNPAYRQVQADVAEAEARVASLQADIARLRETAADPEGAATEALAATLQQIEAVQDLNTETRLTITTTNDLGRASRTVAEDAAEGWDAVSERLAEYAAQASDLATRTGDILTGSMKRLEDAIFEAFQGGEGAARNFFAYLSEQIARLVIQQTIVAPIGNFLSRLFTGGGGGGGGFAGLLARLFHSGGAVGAGGSARRVPASVFAGAQVMHSGGVAGLRHDEVPAILQRGERVISNAEQQRMAGASGGVTRVEVSLSEDLVARTVEQSAGVSVQYTNRALAQRDRNTVGLIQNSQARYD